MKHYAGTAFIATCAVALLLPSVLASDDIRSSAEKKETMKNQCKVIADRLDAFPSSRDVDAFTQIGKDIDSLTATAATHTTEGKEQRRAKLELWLKAIDKVDKMIDPQFDPHDTPQINVAPPIAAGLRAGVAPNEIKDPKVRQEYENAIRLNAEKAERYHVQSKLLDCDKTWTEKVNVYMKTQYSSNAEDVAEIKALIDGNVANKVRRQRLEKQSDDLR